MKDHMNMKELKNWNWWDCWQDFPLQIMENIYIIEKINKLCFLSTEHILQG